MALKLVMVAIYLAILLGIGVVASRRMKDLRDYFAAGKGLGYLAVAFSARATGESAWLLIGLTGMGAMFGLKAMWVVVGEFLGVAGAWWLMSRRFKRLTDRYDAITVPDYLESRFRDPSHLLRLISAGALVVFVTIYVSAQLDATGKAVESFMPSPYFYGYDYWVGLFVGFAVVLGYILAGGFLAVAWSDVFQGFLMLIGLVVLPIAGLWVIGGVGSLVNQLYAIDPSLLSWVGGEGLSAVSIASVLGLALIGLGFLGSPQVFVRFIALKSEKEIHKGALVAVVFTLLADGGAVLIGMIGRALFTGPGQEVTELLGTGAEHVLAMSVEALMPPLIVAIYVAIVLSAIMSTVDSLLVVASSAVVRDVHQKVRRPETPDRALVGMSRVVTFILAFLALAIAIGVAVWVPGRTVFWFVIFGWSGISATFCPVTILSLFWSGTTRRGAIAAMTTGFLAVPLFTFLVPSLPYIGPFFHELNELPPAFLCAFAAGILVSLADRSGRSSLQTQATSDLDYATGRLTPPS